MIAFICFVLAVLASPFKSKSRLEAENAVLRHQLIVLRRRVRGRAQPTNNDRWFLVQMYRWFPSILKVVTIVQPETLVRWHRAGFRRYWRWKSNSRGGRPRIEIELRALIRQMSTENQLWGAPRIHGELLKLGFSVAQSTVAKYMVKRRGPPVIVGNSIRLASEVESDRARQRRVREACDLAPRAAQRFVAGDHCGGKSQRRCPDRYREPFSPISRLLDSGLRHTYAGREQSRGKGIGRGANSAVARPRRSWPTLGGAVWESGERREAEVP
jgi:hypothetical protein